MGTPGNPPQNPIARLSRDAVKPVVWLGPAGGDAPTADDEVDWLVPLEIVTGAGARALDYCRFAYRLAKRGERLIDQQTPVGYARQVEVRLPTEDGETDGKLLFWGDLTIQSVRIDRGETVEVIGRVEPYHFGDPLAGELQYDPITSAEIELHGPLRFNPNVDGATVNNRSSRLDETGKHWLWADPEQIRTQEARDYHEIVPATWTLPDVLEALAWRCNPDETWITNPTRDELSDDPALSDAPEILNLQLRPGRRLPEYLDDVLPPLGIGWHLKFSFDDAGEPLRKLAFFKLGAGTERKVYFQRPGQALDVAKSNVPRPSVTTNVADLANEIIGYGGYEQQEITIELQRGWPEDEDAKTVEELRQTADPDDSDYADFPHAWRLWLGNEAGDLVGLRTSVKPTDTPLDLSGVFDGDTVARRRRIEDCLTKDANGVRRPPFVEYWDDTAEEWLQLNEKYPFRILQDQIGLIFSGTDVPIEIVEQGAEAKLRVTCTVTGDTRLKKTATKQETSPTARTITLHLDLSHRFYLRAVDNVIPSSLISVLKDDPNGADTVDDGEAMQTYLDELRDIAQAAAMQVDLDLHGIHFDYEIGQQITEIDGRKISLNRNSPSASDKLYPQVVGLRWDFQRQQTALIVSTDQQRLA